MGYERNELITIGERFPAKALLDWTAEIVQAARKDMSRLKTRGVTDQTLRTIENAREEVRKLHTEETEETSSLATKRQEAMQEAIDWREETCGLAKAAFDSEPEVLTRFRPGVKISHSLPKLAWETGRLLGVLREHQQALQGVGANDDLVARGKEALMGLEEAQRRLGEEHEQVPASTLDLYCALGVLYTRVRFLNRIAKVEFRNEEDQLARYSYAPLRKQEHKPETKQHRQTVGARSR